MIVGAPRKSDIASAATYPAWRLAADRNMSHGMSRATIYGRRVNHALHHTRCHNMAVRFRIPYGILRQILEQLRLRPYDLFVGDAGLRVARSGDLELLARNFRREHEAAPGGVRRGTIQYSLGFVSFTMRREGVWKVVASTAKIDGEPAPPTCSIMLGSGDEIGRVTGIFSCRDKILPVTEIQVVGPGVHRLPAVDFQRQRPRVVGPREAKRWSRLIGALGGQNAWEQLTSLAYCICGTGRTGSLIANTLAKNGVRDLRLIDPDVVEGPNLDMDLVGERDLGRPKVQAISERLMRDSAHVDVTPLAASVFAPEARALMTTSDVLISSVDDDLARLVIGAMASLYEKILLDVGVGVFRDARGRREAGADVRLIVPGDGCLLDWGGVADPRGAIERWRSGRPRGRWSDERAGSLRSLNAIAANTAIRLLEESIRARRNASTWLRLDSDDGLVPLVRPMPRAHTRNCSLCAALGLGDLLERSLDSGDRILVNHGIPPSRPP